MSTRKQKMISLYKEDQDKLTELASAAMMTESEVIRAMLKIVNPTEENGRLLRIAKKLSQEEVDELRIMADKSNAKKVQATKTEERTWTSQEMNEAYKHVTKDPQKEEEENNYWYNEKLYVPELGKEMCRLEILLALTDCKIDQEQKNHFWEIYGLGKQFD